MFRFLRSVLLFLALLAGAWAVPGARAGQVPCSEVMRASNAQVSKDHGRSADLSEISKRLGTSVAWVERCMQVYGRRPKRPGLESAEGREALMDAYEESEPEESGPEDVEEPGARDRPIHPVKPRYADYKFTPTPELGRPGVKFELE